MPCVRCHEEIWHSVLAIAASVRVCSVQNEVKCDAIECSKDFASDRSVSREILVLQFERKEKACSRRKAIIPITLKANRMMKSRSSCWWRLGEEGEDLESIQTKY